MMRQHLFGTATALARHFAGPALALGVLLAPAATASAVEALHPSLTLPAFASVSADDYFPLLLEWSRDRTVAPVKLRVTYLDPALLLAWLHQTDPAVDEAGYTKALAGFPQALRFRVAYRADERPQLMAKDWQVSLKGPNGADLAPASAAQSVAPDLKSNADGTYWEEDWDYRFDVPAGFLGADLAGLELGLRGPAGTATATWQFGAIAATVDRSRAYVPWLGGALIVLCLVLLAALFVTRAPRRRVL